MNWTIYYINIIYHGRLACRPPLLPKFIKYFGIRHGHTSETFLISYLDVHMYVVIESELSKIKIPSELPKVVQRKYQGGMYTYRDKILDASTLN